MVTPADISLGNIAIKCSSFGRGFLVTPDFIDDYTALMETIETIEADGYWVNILGSFITIGEAGSTNPLVTVHPQGYTKKEAIWVAIVNLIKYLEANTN